ncbi:putative dipeptidase [Amphibalanus amphitrite]|uniref:Dipeptidase n=1 Tax=Amphibalanus amphitrite TaxID=1232801 RepID=A0A6A4W2I8_AMPAM|nr:putative dipeptidase [Amphibalanus amphitrite]
MYGQHLRVETLAVPSSDSLIEVLWVRLVARVHLIVGVIYRPPCGAISPFLEDLHNQLVHVTGLGKPICVVGDTNFDTSQPDKPDVTRYLQALHDLSLKQIVTGPTRPESGSQLDHVIVSEGVAKLRHLKTVQRFTYDVIGRRLACGYVCWLCCALLVVALAAGVGVSVPLVLRLEPSAGLQQRLHTAKQILSQVPLIDGHNDLPWNIRKFVHNNLRIFNFSADLRAAEPWASSPWSHTDIGRLRRGHVGAQLAT